MLKKMLQTDDDVSSLILRVFLGAAFLPHGAQKVLGWFGGRGFQASMDGFTGMGMPWIIALLVILAESLGALGLIFGCLTRLSALGIAAVMTGAIFMVHGKHGFFMNWFGAQQGEGFEYHLLAIAIALALLVKGGGRWSIDRKLS